MQTSICNKISILTSSPKHELYQRPPRYRSTTAGRKDGVLMPEVLPVDSFRPNAVTVKVVREAMVCLQAGAQHTPRLNTRIRVAYPMLERQLVAILQHHVALRNTKIANVWMSPTIMPLYSSQRKTTPSDRDGLHDYGVGVADSVQVYSSRIPVDSDN